MTLTALRVVFSGAVGFGTVYAAGQWFNPPHSAMFMIGLLGYMFAMACTKLEVLDT